MVPVFPTVVLFDLRWASRYASLWPLAGLAAAPQDQSERARKLWAAYRPKLIAAVQDDFRRYRPPVVIVDLREGQFGLPPDFDMLGFFLASPEFQRIWSAYVKIAVSPEYAVYVRREEALPDNSHK
jgi:hypothetical protein